jgi:hypothetical protein
MLFVVRRATALTHNSAPGPELRKALSDYMVLLRRRRARDPTNFYS